MTKTYALPAWDEERLQMKPYVYYVGYKGDDVYVWESLEEAAQALGITLATANYYVQPSVQARHAKIENGIILIKVKLTENEVS